MHAGGVEAAERMVRVPGSCAGACAAQVGGVWAFVAWRRREKDAGCTSRRRLGHSAGRGESSRVESLERLHTLTHTLSLNLDLSLNLNLNLSPNLALSHSLTHTYAPTHTHTERGAEQWRRREGEGQRVRQQRACS